MDQRILLVEPGYRNKYPPLGLMKLAAYHGPNGRGDTVRFVKGDNHEAALQQWDRIYVTTLFSFEWQRTAAAIDMALRAAGGDRGKVFVGGIAATLMHDQYAAEPAWQGIRFIKGPLESPPATALQLRAHEAGAHDLTGTPIEEAVPDYSILEHVEYRYPVVDAYFGYTSRGCIRKCSFCGVPALEGAQRNMPPLSKMVRGVADQHGEKKDLILMDNNVTASPRFSEVVDEIVDLGFPAGATINRNGRKHGAKRRLDFNQGVDARILSKTPSFLQQLSRTCISPLRIAFDHIGLRKPYETSVRMAAECGITNLSNYMLYNFQDSPEDLYRRMALNIELNQALGMSIWSFPMRYQPIALRDRSHVGARWNRHQLRSFQLMLQATRGVVSGQPDFFTYAYGNDESQFLNLLAMPHAYLFNRKHYQSGPGKPSREDYESLVRRMSEQQRQQLLEILSGPPEGKRPSIRTLTALTLDSSLDQPVREALHHHAIEHKHKIETPPAPSAQPPEDEAVEDAGLHEPDPVA